MCIIIHFKMKHQMAVPHWSVTESMVEGFSVLYWDFSPLLRAQCSPCLCSPGLLTHYCLHLQLLTKQSNAVVIPL